LASIEQCKGRREPSQQKRIYLERNEIHSKKACKARISLSTYDETDGVLDYLKYINVNGTLDVWQCCKNLKEREGYAISLLAFV
jgi:hypothetical protein